eukprot:TRINITY_DN343_c0_g1_i11.p1 TRINITY_DN343_c0_g1~~TRINITY_DN343_c0_g1_i11.p1  ORF type:complete len:352 (-),score=19.66 TRINITY_DN343_c0_g1_i11:349-1404(-)
MPSPGKHTTSRCEHGRRRTICRACGGGSICEHDRLRTTCKACGGGSICEHGRRRNDCRDCGGSSICRHRRRGRDCGTCAHSKRSRKLPKGPACLQRTLSPPSGEGDCATKNEESNPPLGDRVLDRAQSSGDMGTRIMLVPVLSPSSLLAKEAGEPPLDMYAWRVGIHQVAYPGPPLQTVPPNMVDDGVRIRHVEVTPLPSQGLREARPQSVEVSGLYSGIQAAAIGMQMQRLEVQRQALHTSVQQQESSRQQQAGMHRWQFGSALESPEQLFSTMIRWPRFAADSCTRGCNWQQAQCTRDLMVPAIWRQQQQQVAMSTGAKPVENASIGSHNPARVNTHTSQPSVFNFLAL